MQRSKSYLKWLALLFMFLFVQSCSKKPNTVQPNPPSTVTSKSVWFRIPNASTTTWYAGKTEMIRWLINSDSSVNRVLVEYQQDASAWNYLFEAQADSCSRGIQVQFDVSHQVRFRIRNASGGMWDTSYTVTIKLDSSQLKLWFTYPQAGDQIKAGDYIFPKYQSRVGDSLTFSMSIDDGATWVDSIQIPPAFGIEYYGLFINYGPSYKCRLRMQTTNGKYSAISDRFTIPNDLADFFPIDVGQDWKYRYTYGYFDQTNFSGWSKTNIIKTHIDSKTQDQNNIFYYCTMITTDTNGVELSRLTDVIQERKTGLHKISLNNPPLNSIPSRYYSSTFDSILINRAVNHAEATSSGGILRKGIGLTQFSYSVMDGYWKKHYYYTWELIP